MSVQLHRAIPTPHTWKSEILWPVELKCCTTGSSGGLLRMRILRKRSPKRLLRFRSVLPMWRTGHRRQDMQKTRFPDCLEYKTLYLSVNVFSTKVLIGDTIFYFSYWRGDRHFTWSSEPREGLAACSTKVVPSFLSYFKTLSIGPAPGIEPATSRSAVTRFTDWANTAAVESSVVEILWLGC